MVKIENRINNLDAPQTPQVDAAENLENETADLTPEQIKDKLRSVLRGRMYPETINQEVTEAVADPEDQAQDVSEEIDQLRRQADEEITKLIGEKVEEYSQDSLIVDYVRSGYLGDDPALFNQMSNLFRKRRIEIEFKEILHHEAFISLLKSGGSVGDFMNIVDKHERGEELFAGGRGEEGTINYNRAIVKDELPVEN